MYLRRSKHYPTKGNNYSSRRRWRLYLIIAAFLILGSALWHYRDSVDQPVLAWVQGLVSVSGSTTPLPAISLAHLTSSLDESFQTGQIDQAVVTLKKIVQLQPNDIKDYSLLAQITVFRSYGVNQNALSEAADIALQAINADPESSAGWLSEALALDWNNNPRAALPYALQAHELDSKDPMVLAVLGEIYLDLNQIKKAQPWVEQAIRTAKIAGADNRAALVHAYYVNALLATAMSASDNGVSQLEEAWTAINVDPVDNTIPGGYIAQLLASHYTTEEQAVNLLQLAIAHDKNDPILYKALAKTYLRFGEPDKASAYLQQCREFNTSGELCETSASESSLSSATP